MTPPGYMPVQEIGESFTEEEKAHWSAEPPDETEIATCELERENFMGVLRRPVPPSPGQMLFLRARGAEWKVGKVCTCAWTEYKEWTEHSTITGSGGGRPLPAHCRPGEVSVCG